MWLRVLFLTLTIYRSIDAGCPIECECYYRVTDLYVDCSGKYLEHLPFELDYAVIGLDLSMNLLKTIPPDISSYTLLERLNVSNNQIAYIDQSALSGLANLLVLDLSRNNISGWSDIRPHLIFNPLVNIKKLIISNNRLGPLNLNIEEKLNSNSLEELILTNCAIPSGELNVDGLTALKNLVLSNNPIRKFYIQSQSLESLDLSRCDLTRLSRSGLDNLPMLKYLYVSHNIHLNISKVYSLASTSLRILDASFCNMDSVSLSEIPNLTKVCLRGNMLKYITGEEFANNTRLEHLDMSSNLINTIHYNSFHSLTSLKFLNLSINNLYKLHDSTFAKTTNLTKVILFRNFIPYLGNLHSPSIKRLDMSKCEIQEVSSDLFGNMPSIEELSLSRNLISYVPSMRSSTLKTLDLSFNRIGAIDNDTFKFLPGLSKLYLSENRFTTIFQTHHFANNTMLSDISLGDNMWRCDCHDEEMKYFFMYLTFEPPKIWDMNSLICNSPLDVKDVPWFKACYSVWTPTMTFQTNRAMNFFMGTLGAFLICFCILYMIRKGMRNRILAEEEERRRAAAETREQLRQLETAREQQELLNAPDPRDLISPPSYTEALLMPKLDRSFYSLSNINEAGKKKKRARRRTKSSNDLLEEGTSSNNNNPRCKSDYETNNRRRHKITQSTGNIDNDEDESDNIEEQPPVRVLHESDL